MLTLTQQNLLDAAIQQRNDSGEPLAKDVFEVMKKVSKDWAEFLEEGNYDLTFFDSGFDAIFEEFISQYNPQL